MTYREKEITACLDCAEDAVRLADHCRTLAKRYMALRRPDYAQDELYDCERHFERAYGYLERVRMQRATQ